MGAIGHRRYGLIALGVWSAALLSGCTVGPADDQDAEPKPTARSVQQLRSARFPVYWLGTSYRGMKLTSTRLLGDRAVVRYGAPACDPGSGCVYPLSVFSGLRTEDTFPRRDDTRNSFGRPCFKHVRGAILMGCDGDGEYELLTGKGDIGFQIDDD
jgi:hypothetical protein